MSPQTFRIFPALLDVLHHLAISQVTLTGNTARRLAHLEGRLPQVGIGLGVHLLLEVIDPLPIREWCLPQLVRLQAQRGRARVGRTGAEGLVQNLVLVGRGGTAHSSLASDGTLVLVVSLFH